VNTDALKDASKYLKLSDAIDRLKQELREAQDKAHLQGDAMLALKECEIELALEIKPKLGGGIDIGIFSFEAGVEAKGVHKIKLTFAPVDTIVALARVASADSPQALPPETPNAHRTA